MPKQINLTNITSDNLTEIILRNFMVASNNDIKISANNNIDVKCYGYNMIGDNVTLSVVENLNNKISLYDGVIKANQIIEDIIPYTTTTTTQEPM